MKYSNRSIWKRIIWSPFFVVVMFVVVFILIRAVLNMSGKAQLSETRLGQAQNELNKLNERKQELSSKVSILSTEQGMEAEARTRFHAVKEGESVAVIIDGSPTSNPGAVASSSEATNKIPWWGRLLRFLGF